MADDNVLSMGERDDRYLSPREAIEQALADADEMEVVLIVGRAKDDKAIYTGWSRGDAQVRIGLCAELLDKLMRTP